MCHRFIEDFTNKVTQKAICCDFCREKNRKCQIPNSFNYLPEEIYSYIIDKDQVRSWMSSKETCIDIILSALHGNIYYFLKYLSKPECEVWADFYHDKSGFKFQIIQHLNCIPDEQLIYTDFDWTVSAVFDFYCENQLHTDFYNRLKDAGDSQTEIKQMKFKDWLTELMVR